MKKNYFGWSGVYFIFILHLLLRADIPSFFTAEITSQISKRHLSAWNIWTFSRRFSRNLTPRSPKKYFNSICVLFILIILKKYFTGTRLPRCLISSKTVEISRSKFHEIREKNNAHDVTMTSNTYRFCWNQVLTSKVWSRL